MPTAAKVAYQPFGLVASMAGGLVAGLVFKQIWRKVADEDDAPDPLQSEYGWREILVAAAVQGAIYGLVKAAIDRAGAETFAHWTGEWPGD